MIEHSYKVMVKTLETIQTQKGITYDSFHKMIAELLAEGKTTGENHSEAMIHYTVMNQKRMLRHDKNLKFSDEVKELFANYDRKVLWVVLTEAWCGDAAHTVPVMAKLAELSENIELQILLRDENLELMDEYLTNGGRSIPKLIAFDAETKEEIGNWGPRPVELQESYMQMRAEEKPFEEIKEVLQKWYNKDKGQTTIQEIVKSVLK
ncbi:thioredoxin family protein [Sediminitomix flava]|uniref:Thioredoxin-like protein n=1 Tax=Sediminitomix flava TaxID=379075 RepID=A0A315ZFL8_SEDFL|nr:thioredoxin family protein [Sediminitomix flava]PWJ44365.1 thioredoxin-like protein [Sediminitomix flava]